MAARPHGAAQGLFEGCQSSVQRYLPHSGCYQGLTYYTNNVHEENAAVAKPHAPCSAPQAELQNLRPWVLSAEGQRHQIFPEIPAAGRAGSTVQSPWFTALAAASKEEKGLGGRTEQAQ